MLRKNPGGVLEFVKTAVYAVLIAIGIRTVAFEPFNIPSGSMIPTLLIGDYLFVSKYSYGYSKYSLPYGMPLFGGRIFGRAPERGEVAVFKLPRDPKVDYIKRIVGLPGDRIQVKGGILHINDQPVKRERIEDYVAVEYGVVTRTAQYIETLPNGRQHRILEISDNDQLDNTPVYTVPAGHFFAMGDNRDNSQDSRVLSAVGFIPAENLVGRAEVLFFSTDGGASLIEPWKWPFATRYSRLFKSID
ncbi:MAG: signal peptidase I [Rhodospirillales bacterium]|nr:signal peptidase I [Rhodospirillales bacterium]